MTPLAQPALCTGKHLLSCAQLLMEELWLFAWGPDSVDLDFCISARNGWKPGAQSPSSQPLVWVV